jgi:hypothetical protein
MRKSTEEATEIQRKQERERKEVQQLKNTSVKLSELVNKEENFC